MGKYLVSTGSHFTPYSYEQLIKPVQQMTDAQNAAADYYDALNLETEALGRYISENDNDSDARAIYKNYRDKLHALQDDLWENGYSARARRGLTEARSGYANDVLRLKKAVETRQTRSKEYWDAVHKNPDLIVGNDPALGGLNDYLRDDNYGANWFSYSGVDFMKNVAADAQARAQEFYNKEVDKQNNIPGYITQITKHGFTNAQVDDAVKAVRDGSYTTLKEGPVKILADVLASHIQSTGATADNISKEQYNRFFDYGRTGLAQGIGKAEFKDYNDVVDAENRAWRKFKREYDYALNNPKGGSGSGKSGKGSDGSPYTINNVTKLMESSNARGIIDKKNKYFSFAPVVTKSLDGATKQVSNFVEAREVLDELGRKKLRSEYGLNPEDYYSIQEGFGKLDFTLPSGREARIKRGTTGPVYMVKDINGKFVIDEYKTKQLEKDLHDYNTNLAAWKKENPDVDIEKMAVSKKDMTNLYKETGTPAEVPQEYIPYIMDTQARIGKVSPAHVADASMDSALKMYTDNIISAQGDIRKDKKGRVAKTSSYAFYPVNGYDIDMKHPERNAGNILGTDAQGRFKNDNLNSIELMPEDLLYNKVRIKTKDGRTYAVDPFILGDAVDYAINGTDENGHSLRSRVLEAMFPILHPELSINMYSEDVQRWRDAVEDLCGDQLGVQGLHPRSIVVNPQNQVILRSAIVNAIEHQLADAREYIMHHQMQDLSGSSANPNSFNVNIADYGYGTDTE